MKRNIGICALFFIFLISACSPDIKNTNPSGDNIICFGDSLTFGTGASTGMDYPARLSLMIHQPVINAGRPGDTTTSALERLDEAVLLKSPRMVLMTLGGNDLKNGVPKEIAFQNLRIIIERMQDQGALVILGGIKLILMDKGYGKEYERLCREMGVVYIPHILSGIMGKREKMSDPIHPNDEGYALMAEKFYKALKPYL